MRMQARLYSEPSSAAPAVEVRVWARVRGTARVRGRGTARARAGLALRRTCGGARLLLLGRYGGDAGEMQGRRRTLRSASSRVARNWRSAASSTAGMGAPGEG